MTEIIQTLMQQFSGNTMNALSTKVGVEPQKAQAAMGSALPILMQALSKNSSSPQGASSLLSALDKDHDGSILDDLADLVNNPAKGHGNGILRHLLGDKRPMVEQHLAKENGISPTAASQLLEVAAPALMGLLGKQKKQAPGSGNDMVSSILQNFTGQMQDQSTGGLLNSLLDQNGDGSVADDVSRLGGGLLKGLFRRK